MRTDMWWWRYGRCREMDLDLFFPPDNITVRKQAKEACDSCAVKKLCLEHALEHEPYGYWGGTSARERFRMKGRKDVKASAVHVPDRLDACGTNAGYYRHRRRNEKACFACLQAHAEYKRITRSAAAPSSQGSAIRELRGAAVSSTKGQGHA